MLTLSSAISGHLAGIYLSLPPLPRHINVYLCITCMLFVCTYIYISTVCYTHFSVTFTRGRVGLPTYTPLIKIRCSWGLGGVACLVVDRETVVDVWMPCPLPSLIWSHGVVSGSHDKSQRLRGVALVILPTHPPSISRSYGGELCSVFSH